MKDFYAVLAFNYEQLEGDKRLWELEQLASKAHKENDSWTLEKCMEKREKIREKNLHCRMPPVAIAFFETRKEAKDFCEGEKDMYAIHEGWYRMLLIEKHFFNCTWPHSGEPEEELWYDSNVSEDGIVTYFSIDKPEFYKIPFLKTRPLVGWDERNK